MLRRGGAGAPAVRGGDYSGTIEVGSGSVYLGVWGEGLTGACPFKSSKL